MSVFYNKAHITKWSFIFLFMNKNNSLVFFICCLNVWIISFSAESFFYRSWQTTVTFSDVPFLCHGVKCSSSMSLSLSLPSRGQTNEITSLRDATLGHWCYGMVRENASFAKPSFQASLATAKRIHLKSNLLRVFLLFYNYFITYSGWIRK